MKIVNLALANIKKGKGAAISLFILIFIAALLLNVGMTVISKMNTFYDDKVEELHDAHVNIIMNSSEYKPSYEDFLKNYSGVSETETEQIILMNTAKFRYGDSDLSLGAAILNADTSRRFSPLKLIEKLDSINSQDMYVPYSFKTSGGYKLGDNFTINYQDKDYSYRIAGFFEVTMMGTNNNGMMKFILPDSDYHQLSDKLGKTADGILMSASLTDSTQSAELLNDYNKQFSHPHWGADIAMMKSVNTMTVNIVAMILVAFAAVIVLVSLIVIKFRVTNSIDDGMVNIGVLKAVGYTSWQIIASMALQFMLIALSAGVIGVLISYTVMPVFGGIISSLAGLQWSQSFDIAINLVSILVVVVLVLTVALLSSSRIRKLHPVAALRGGIMTHSFKKNLFPLEKGKGGLHFVLACKTMITNSRQNIMIAIIIAAITFASIFSIVLYYNVAVDKTAFIHLVGSETSNVVVQSNHDVDSDKLLADIEQMDGVTKTALLEYITATIDGQSVYMSISDDYSKLNNNVVYKGRNPQYDNEIAVSGAMAKLLHKSIGDTVKVEMNDVSRQFLITGLSQSLNYMGKITSVTLPGVQHLIPDYTGTIINVYLKDVGNADFIRDFKAKYGTLIKDITDVDEMLASQSSVYISAVLSVMVTILAITVLVVALILYLVIKTMILKRKRDFGILKATGYTTLQLMTQIVLSFVPVVIVGAIIGGVLGSLCTNSVLTLLLSGAGVYNVQFIVNIPLIVVLCVGLIVLAYLISMLVARRIKRITAYGLITE
ncbi:FtsX-like permease family protein [Paenibacillus sp. N3/727]|uniref:ABC transporter permease n=1 Tax=Paenibacillus sp. N3/727 TaxID=2925845 RepID=UPI001F53C226|nr:ABC transporter permease [Paenibacillus sp. N3/727]UNK18750.1 FtsX-like permease family protein [Paenibacillus sp. N3/727]